VAIAAVVTGVLAVTLGAFAYLWSRSGARPVSLEEARRRFLEEHLGDAQAGRRFTPAEGVYAYAGSGSESLSTPPKSQSEGPGMPGTVSHRADGCWTFRLDYSTNHWREWRFCPEADRLVETASRVYQRWDFVVSTVDNMTAMTCDPPTVVFETTMAPGAAWPASCRGESTRIEGTTVSKGRNVYVGPDRIRVGDTTVDAYHFRNERVVSDAQVGTEEFELWLARDGLPLRGRQRIVVDSDSPLGRVTYTQEGMFVLVSLAPTR